jgi:hypothetical protein
MTTKFIGIKDFRQNIAKYAKAAQSKKVRYVVMNRTKPLFEISPFDEDVYLESFYEQIVAAERDVAAGNFITHEQILEKIRQQK